MENECSETQKSRFHTRTTLRTSAYQEENILSSCVEHEVDDGEPSTSTSGYLNSISEVSSTSAGSRQHKTVRFAKTFFKPIFTDEKSNLER